MTVINTNQPCVVGQRIDHLRDVRTGAVPHVRLLVMGPATRTDWDREWPDSSPPFIYGFYYRVSTD